MPGSRPMTVPDSHPRWLDRMAGLLRRIGALGHSAEVLLPRVDGSVGRRVLREAIERKRRNDLARRLELDRLRLTLRQGTRSGAGQGAEVSGFVHSSLLPFLQEQSRTIEKIDAVEAQLSRQWWKGRVGGGAVEVPRQVRSVVPAGPHAAPDDRAYATTRLSSTGHSVDPNDPLSPGTAAAYLKLKPSPTPESVAEPRAMALANPLADPLARSVEATLEEASLRFANGDDGGAQACLTAALAGDASAAVDPRWGLALLDLFRLTGQQTQFDAALPAHLQRFAGAVPSWYSVPERLTVRPAAVLATGEPPSALASAASWVCPARLTLDGVAAMQTALASADAPWRLDWDRLDAIASDAVAPLQTVFAQWCDEQLVLSFHGAAALEAAVRALTPSGDATSPLVGWQLRLTALRLLGQRDEFELAALDGCITHGMTPHRWLAARCQLNRLARTDPPSPRADAGPLGPKPPAPDAALELRGELRGDRPATLGALVLAPAGAGAGVMVVSCADLMRVDFSAAGRLLTWVLACLEAGRKVRFDDVPYLVAAFFHVIGIDEHAQVVVRTH